MTAPRQPQPLGSSDRAEPGIPQKIIDLYDDYTHLTLDRRRFFDHLTRVAGGTAPSYALLPLPENNYAAAAPVAPADARVPPATVSFPSAPGPPAIRSASLRHQVSPDAYFQVITTPLK